MDKLYYTRIFDLRKENNLSQYELSKFLDVHRSTLSNYELGNKNLTMTSLKSLANVFDVSIDYLIYNDDYRNHHDFIQQVLGLEDESIKILASNKKSKEINKFIQNIIKECE